MFLDLSSNSIFKVSNNFKKKIIDLQKKLNLKIIVIDSINNESIYYPKKNSNRVVPYYVEEKNINSGFKYVIINEKYKRIQKNKFNNKNLKILVTFGGHDTNKTLKTIKALSLINQQIKIRIIIGLLCNNKEEKLIKNIQKKYLNNKNCKIISNIKDISKHINWSNLVISSDGITKYELVVAGRSGVILRNSFTNYIYGKSFEKLKLCNFVNFKTYNSISKYSVYLNNIIKNRKKIATQSITNYKIREKINISNYLSIIK